MQLEPGIVAFQDEMTAWRRDLHAHPETAFEEHRTARLVADKLRGFGVDELHEGIGGTGVVALIRGREPGNRSIGLRCDMDALPIAEETGKPWASTVPGKMHACGHDGHTAMLLGAARHLAATRGFAGTVTLVFQPAEEGRGGGKRMIDDGLLDRFPIDSIWGLHNWPSLPLGSFAMCKGPAMAAADQFTITLAGRGGHAALPHLARDPVTAAALLVQALQLIVSRETDPADRAVISVTRLRAGDTFNVIPERAELQGTVRSFRSDTRERLQRRLEQTAQGIATTTGLTAGVEYRRGYPPTVNHPAEAALGADVAAAIAGEDRVERSPEPSMGAEDFAYMLERRPGAYIWLGIGGADEGRTLHSAGYDFDDRALAIGATWWVRLVETVLGLSEQRRN